MTDVFDTTILCKKCNRKMHPHVENRQGLELRAVKCPECGDVVVHPADLNGFEHFNDLKDKKFNVKLRMVGNSHTISIPKEIIDFMNERQKEMKRQMDDMVSLCFDDFDSLRVNFWDEDDFDESKGNVKRSVRDYGKGNMDIVEEQSLNNHGRHMKKLRVRKIRRNAYNGE